MSSLVDIVACPAIATSGKPVELGDSSASSPGRPEMCRSSGICPRNRENVVDRFQSARVAPEHFAFLDSRNGANHLNRGQLDERHSPRFSNTPASELTGVTPQTLLNWCTRDFLKPSVSPGRTGPGGERMYSFRDLVAIRVADDLRSRGIDVRYLHSAVDYIRNREGLELDRVLPADVFLLSDGRTFREVQFGPTFGERVLGAMQFAPSGPYSMLFIPFSKFVHEIQTKARACSQSAAVTPRPYPADEERR